MPGTNLSREEASERARIIRTQDYRVELDLTEKETFTSRTTIHFTATEGSSTFIDLIAQSVDRITLNGEELPIESYEDSRIPLPNLLSDNELYVSAVCEYSHTGEGLHRAVDPADGEAYLYSQFEVADSRRMFAVFEQPDLKAEFTFIVRAPETWKVFSVSPTPLPTTNGDGSATWEFTPTEHISSYLTCIIAGPYEGTTGSYTSVDGREIPMGAYARKSLAPYLDGDEVIKIAKDGMPFYENSYKQPYPFRKYDQIFVPEYNAGAMEHPGCVTILDDYVFRSRATAALIERRAITILHELAHMWFGDLVTMKWWDDLWLNESFAEYMSHVAAAETSAFTEAWVIFNSSEKSWAQEQDQLPSTHPIAANIRDLEDVLVNFDGITYGKGASVFQQLVAYVGWDAFITGVQQYLAKKAWGNATLHDLLIELEAASGRDLTTWSKLWLEEAGINILTPSIKENSDGTIKHFTIVQDSDGIASLRPHRIGVGGYDLVDGKFVRSIYAELDIDGESTPVPDFEGAKRPQLILINDGDLAYAKVRLDPDSLSVAVDNINAFTDRLTCTLLLLSAWDMCRDAEMPATDFARLALRALETESHGTVLRYLLRELSIATNLYSHPSHRESLQIEVGEQIYALAIAAEPGTDRQLQLALSAISLAHTDAQISAVAEWLDGASAPKGLVMDANMRWAIIKKLAIVGHIDESGIEKERLERDNTASGAAEAAYARGALSDPDVKERAWNELTGGEIPNSIQRALALGFSASQPGSLVPYVERYFGTVEQQWTERTKEIASNMIEYSFPTSLVGRDDLGVDVIAQGDEWMSTHQDSAPALRRLVSEVLDDAKRAKRAQGADA